MQEPQDHALGRSRGGFGTKVHVVCDSGGTIVGIHLTAGQRHESKFFEQTLARRLFHRRKGARRWPRRLAGDKGYSYPRIRRWCKRRRVEAVIPTRKDQPRDESFDKATYKRRNSASTTSPSGSSPSLKKLWFAYYQTGPSRAGGGRRPAPPVVSLR
jgi:hypothetical protein